MLAINYVLYRDTIVSLLVESTHHTCTTNLLAVRSYCSSCSCCLGRNKTALPCAVYF